MANVTKRRYLKVGGRLIPLRENLPARPFLLDLRDSAFTRRVCGAIRDALYPPPWWTRVARWCRRQAIKLREIARIVWTHGWAPIWEPRPRSRFGPSALVRSFHVWSAIRDAERIYYVGTAPHRYVAIQDSLTDAPR